MQPVGVRQQFQLGGPFDEQFVAEYAEMFYQHTEAQILDSTAFEQAFGVRPTPLGRSLDDTRAWPAAAPAAAG